VQIDPCGVRAWRRGTLHRELERLNVGDVDDAVGGCESRRAALGPRLRPGNPWSPL
jgi:hypothetical protein